MHHARPCSALLTLTLAVTPMTLLGGNAPALAGGRGAGTPPSYFYGLHHTPLGGATLGTDPAGRLVVNNIGSSGQDGVSIDLGKTTGFAMQCDIGPSGALPTGSRTTLRSHFETGSTPSQAQLHLQESGGGQCDVLLDYTGEAATCVHVELLLSGVRLRDIRIVHPPGTPPGTWLAHGNVGSVGGSPPTCEWKVEEGEKRCSIFRPSTGEWLLALPGQAPVACDQVAVTLEGLPPNPCVVTQCDVLASNPNPGGGSVTVAGESIKIKHKGWDGLIYHRAAAVGDAHITGVAGPDICAGCYECCHPNNGDALRISSGIQLSNIGSSGNDGVAISCVMPDGSSIGPEIEMVCSPIALSEPDSMLQFTVTGRFSDGSTRDVTARLTSNPDGGATLSADFSALSSVEALVEIYSGATQVGSVLVPNPPGTPLGSLVSLDGNPVSVISCGSVTGDALSGRSGVSMVSSSNTLYIFGGQVFVGDQMHVRASDSTLSIEGTEVLMTKGVHFPAPRFIVRRVASSTSPAPATVVLDGVLHSALGQCALESRDSDGDGVNDLLISNIGSSGQDGVEIKLGRAQGGAVSFAGNGVTASNQFSHMHYEIGDDECAMCPGGAVASMDIDVASPSSAIFSAQGRGVCCRGHVTLLKRGASLTDGGNDVHFPLIDNDPWSIAAVVGATISVGELSSQFGFSDELSAGAGTDIHQLAMHITLSQASAGSASTGVTVSHPLHGTFTDIGEIVVTQCIDIPPNVGTIDRARLLVTASSVCNPCSVTLRSTDVAQFLHMHKAGGQARLVAEDCDDADPAFSPTLWVANIGSSGQDGVSIDLGRSLRERSCAGEAVPDVVGVSGYFKPTAGTLFTSYALTGSLTGNPAATTPLASVVLQSTGPNQRQCTCPLGEYVVGSIRVTVRDQFGNAMISLNGLPPGTRWCGITGSDEPGHYTGSFTVTLSSTLVGGPSMLVHDWTQTLDWPSDMTFEFAGHPPVVGRSLEMFGTPPGGTPVAADFRLNALRIASQAPAGSVLALGITDEQVIRMPPVQPCPADTNGDHNVNVADLLSVISAWGTCQSCPATPCPADINHDCSVNVADLLTVISSWGACP